MPSYIGIISFTKHAGIGASNIVEALYPATLTHGLFLRFSHDSSHRRKVNPKVLANLLVTVGSRLVRRPHRFLPIPMPFLDILERWRRSLTLRPRDIDVFAPSTLQLPLHPLDEAITAQIDLLPKLPPYTLPPYPVVYEPAVLPSSDPPFVVKLSQ